MNEKLNALIIIFFTGVLSNLIPTESIYSNKLIQNVQIMKYEKKIENKKDKLYIYVRDKLKNELKLEINSSQYLNEIKDICDDKKDKTNEFNIIYDERNKEVKGICSGN